MTLWRKWIRNPRGGKCPHHLSGLQGDFGFDFWSIGDSSQLAIQLPRGDEHGIANLFGGESSWWEGRIELAPRIFLSQELTIGMFAAPAVCFRVHDQSMHRLHRPASLDERRREPVQQFGMRGTA